MSETHGIPSDHHAHAAPTLSEPKTPMWLPALGAFLFLVVGLIWGLLPSADDAATDSAKADAAAAGKR